MYTETLLLPLWMKTCYYTIIIIIIFSEVSVIKPFHQPCYIILYYLVISPAILFPKLLSSVLLRSKYYNPGLDISKLSKVLIQVWFATSKMEPDT